MISAELSQKKCISLSGFILSVSVHSRAKQDLERDNDSSTLMRLKTDRDLLKRLVDSGAWVDEAEAAVWLN